MSELTTSRFLPYYSDMMNRITVCLFLFLTVGIVGGCATEKLAGGRVHVAVLTGGQVSVDGSKVGIATLGKKLKSMGATPSTTIMISIPKTATSATLSDVTRSLASAGFQQIIFTKPVEVEATVSDTTSTNPATTAPAKSSKSKTSTLQKPVRSGTL